MKFQLVALVSVSDGSSRTFGGSVDDVVPGSDQPYNMARGATDTAYSFLGNFTYWRRGRCLFDLYVVALFKS
jgi:hypothetical protein